MKYLYSSKNTQILTEFTDEKGGLLNALLSEPFLKTIRNTKVLLNKFIIQNDNCKASNN
jgi:hypothetical protein